MFFDRDGIVNASPGPGYVERCEDFVLLPAFVAALRLVRAHGYVAVVVTNQRGVARGIVPLAEVERMHDHLRETLARDHDLELLDILVCPHERDSCDCRKPKPGMLLEAARRHGLDLASSWMVGDNETDIQAGRAAGCRTIRVSPETETAADYRVPDLKALAGLLGQVLV